MQPTYTRTIRRLHNKSFWSNYDELTCAIKLCSVFDIDVKTQQLFQLSSDHVTRDFNHSCIYRDGAGFKQTLSIYKEETSK